MQNILRTAKTVSLNGLIGGLISALDVMSAGGSKEEVLAAFCIGVPVGIAGGAIFRGVGGVLTKFMGAKLANATIALTGFGLGMYGAGRSISEGEYWQALYRAGVSTLGISLWYRQFGAETNKLLQDALQRLKGGSNGQSTGGNVYYHVTTQENAEKIISSGTLGKYNNTWESRVFAWNKQPTQRQASIAGIGKDAKVVIKFSTNASFEPDAGNSSKIIADMVVQTTDGQRVPIYIDNIEVVGFKKGW